MNEIFVNKVCPFCKSEIKKDDEVVICSRCEMPHHKDCWIENQGCTTFGCDGTVQSPPTGAGADNSGTANFDQPPSFEAAPLFCGKCGARLTENAAFCARCGSPTAASAQAAVATAAPSYPNTSYAAPFPYAQPDSSHAQVDPYDVQNNKGLSVLCYFGPLLLIPLLVRPRSAFVRFHANQGLVCLINALLLCFFMLLPIVRWFAFAAMIVLAVFQLIGIANSLRGLTSELPLIGRIQLLK